ncbi:MAG: hypothetical protein JNL92_18305 [Opitutaceae bacterium]|nr:hypothetical protein [Opitutaceae bacterium]
MNFSHLRRAGVGALLLSVSLALGSAADAPALLEAPQPRPRLTETLRAKAEEAARASASAGAVAMDKVVVRESRLPAGPPKEEQRDGEFSITQGGYILKRKGDKFSTEVGLWRHLDIMEDRAQADRQSTRIRMGFLRVSW